MLGNRLGNILLALFAILVILLEVFFVYYCHQEANQDDQSYRELGMELNVSNQSYSVKDKQLQLQEDKDYLTELQQFNKQANKDLNTAIVYTSFPTNKTTSQQLDTMCYIYNTTTPDLVKTIKKDIKLNQHTIKHLQHSINKERQSLAHHQHQLNHTLEQSN